MDLSVVQKCFYFERPHPLLVEILWGWALQGHAGAGHSGDTLGLVQLQGDSGAGHSGDNLGVGHRRDTLTPGTLWGWALQGTGRGEELSLTSNNPIPRVGNNDFLHRRPEPQAPKFTDPCMQLVVENEVSGFLWILQSERAEGFRRSG